MEVKEAFKFCPRCGAKGQQKNNLLACPACGLDTYFNPKPVQSVILKNDKGEYLFVIRSVEPRKGYLDFPGGFVEEGENFEQTTAREIKEELGIDMDPSAFKYLSSHTDEYTYEDINYKVTGVTFTADLPAGVELKPADDVSGVEFYKLEDIPMDRLAFPSMHQMIANLQKTTN